MIKSKEIAGADMGNEDRVQKQPMEFYNMSDFLRVQSSKLITGLSEDDKIAFVLKNGRPVAILMSNDRY